jgi:hypothetical protein
VAPDFRTIVSSFAVFPGAVSRFARQVGVALVTILRTSAG